VRRLRAYVSGFTGFERDARRYLLITVVWSSAVSLYWIDFNLYLASLGVPRPTIGLIATGSALAGAIIAFPTSRLSDRIGRRLVIAGATALMALAIAGLLTTTSVVLIALLAAAFGAAAQSVEVLESPFLTEHSKPEHRSELFSLQFALSSLTNLGAALAGGVAATLIGDALGLERDGPGIYRVILVLMVVLLIVAVVLALSLRPDRPDHRGRPGRGQPVGDVPRRPGGLPNAMAGRRRFAKLVIPGFLIAIGAGQVIPFLNLYIERKFGLDLASVNAVFALTSLGTMTAILLQPALARRLGRIGSVVTVQATSIPFLVVLGFSPVLWTVVIAMTVRNSLMNAANPILNAFAMDQVAPSERATLSATMATVWSMGWVIGGPYYSLLQGTLGFEMGYAVNFLTMIVLYSVGTSLYWLWFRDAEPRPVRATSPA
jgi:MFS family permease